jgi:hypothetical protein
LDEEDEAVAKNADLKKQLRPDARCQASPEGSRKRGHQGCAPHDHADPQHRILRADSLKVRQPLILFWTLIPIDDNLSSSFFGFLGSTTLGKEFGHEGRDQTADPTQGLEGSRRPL